MSDYLLHCAASNWLVSSVLAAFAWFAQSKLRSPVIAHLLWLLVLVKLVTPPLFSLAVLPAPAEAAAPVMTEMVAVPTDVAPVMPMPEVATVASLDATTMLLGLWLLGSVIVLVWSTIRIVRFHRLLTQASRPANQDLVKRATQLATTLGLKKTPSINITSARVSPMVWWVGGKVRIFIPEAMPAELGGNKMRWILAHELGHVRRGDHFVRWLEWLACVAFWWNPIAWLARRNLRANEEVCCDALVLRSLKGKPHSYANSLLAAVEFLAAPGLRPPAMASEINSGGFLERRFRMIVSKTPIAKTPRWLQAVLLVCTVSVMPLGIAYAQNPDVGAVTKRLRKAVQAGELSPVEARKMLRTLKEADKQDPRRAGSKKAKEQEHYNRLVKSLKEGLSDGIESGQLTKEEAIRLYDRQMAILKNGVVDRTQRAIKNAQDKTFDLAQLKRALQRAIKNGRITPEQAKERAAEWVKKQMDAGMELDVNTQSLRQTADKLRSIEGRAVREAELKDNAQAKRHELIRAEYEETRRQLEKAKLELDKAQASRARQLRHLETIHRDKEVARQNQAAKLEGLEKARRDLDKKAALIRKMQIDLAKEKAMLEGKVQFVRTGELDLSLSREEAARISAEKAEASKRNRIRWDARRNTTKKKDDLDLAKQLRRVDFSKAKKDRDLAEKARAIDFSKKKATTARDLNRLRGLELELKQRGLEMQTADKLRAKELEMKKRALDTARETQWRAVIEKTQKDGTASYKPVKVQLEIDTTLPPIKKKAAKNVKRTWRSTATKPTLHVSNERRMKLKGTDEPIKKASKKPRKVQWDTRVNTPIDSSKRLSKERSKLILEQLHAEQTKAADEVSRAKDLLNERSVRLQRVLDTRIDADKAEELKQRAIKLEREAVFEAHAKQAADLKKRQIELEKRTKDLKRELDVRRTIEKDAQEAAKVRKESRRRRAGIR